jgi:glycine/D-amino acid oxidase-like deaminating enzyme
MTESVLIVGNGVFGLSASAYLRRQERQFRICIKSEPHAPSRDIAKISRTDYPGLVRMKEAQAAHKLWTTDDFYKRFCTKVGRIVAYDSENSRTLRMINENRHKCNLERREILGIQAVTEAFGGSPSPDLVYVYNDDDALIDWTSVMESLHSSVVSEATAPVRRLIPGPNRVDAVVIDHPVHGEDRFDTTNTKVILAAGPWVMTILDRSGIEGPPAGLPLTALLAFHLAIDDEQNAFYSTKPIFSHIGTGRRRCIYFSPCRPAALTFYKAKYFLRCMARR